MIKVAIVTGCILLLPLIAMQFSEEVAWSPADFVFAGVLLFGTGVAYKLIASKGKDVLYRAASGLALAGCLLLIWVNGAVGIIGSENNPANLMYFVIAGVGIIGAAISRLQPLGLARTLFVMALVQMLIPIAALIFFKTEFSADERIWNALGANLAFVLIFAASAMIFRHAGTMGKTVNS